MKHTCLADRTYYVVVYMLASLAVVITLYPFLYTIGVSFSSAQAVDRNEIWLLPVDFSLSGYRQVLTNAQLYVAFGNSLFYTVCGTMLNLVFTSLAAYPLSRREFVFRKRLNFFVAFTLYFNAGLIPSYLLITSLGLYNSRLVMMIPSLIITSNLMICRSAFSALPEELLESARIDGAGDWTTLCGIAIPLIKPTLAVLTLYYAVGHWNNYMTALLYLPDKAKEPLQLLLRRVLIQSSEEFLQGTQDITMMIKNATTTQIRYVTIVVSTIPILCVYPFLQKYFVKGTMLGAIKG